MTAASKSGNLSFASKMNLVRVYSSKLSPLIGCSRSISTTQAALVDQKWRKSRGLPTNPNQFGPLTTLPDYTFMDGRPTPVGMNLIRRMERQKEAAVEMVEKIRELDFAKDRYAKMQKEKVEYRERVIGSKLKPKGPLLLKK